MTKERDIFAETMSGPIKAVATPSVPELVEEIFDGLARLDNSVNNLDTRLGYYLRPAEPLTSAKTPEITGNVESALVSKLYRMVQLINETRSHVDYVEERVQ